MRRSGTPLDILAAYLTGSLDRRPTILTNFAPAGGPDETMLAEGPYGLSEFTAGAGGSFLVGGTGALGLTLLAGTAIYSANRNAVRWRQIDHGQLTISTHCFYLGSHNGLRPWAWSGMDAVTVVGPGLVHLQGCSERGAVVSWLARSDWSELLFVFWALARHRQHPQLLAGTWLPAGWTERAARCGYPAERQTTEIAAALQSG